MSLFASKQTFIACQKAAADGRHSTVSVTAEGGAFRVRTPYHGDFVAQLKAVIPAASRSYDPPTKTWLVAGSCGTALADLLAAFFGHTRPLPAIAPAAVSVGRRVLTEILEWSDITNEQGKTMISSWSGDTFSQMWV